MAPFHSIQNTPPHTWHSPFAVPLRVSERLKRAMSSYSNRCSEIGGPSLPKNSRHSPNLSVPLSAHLHLQPDLAADSAMNYLIIASALGPNKHYYSGTAPVTALVDCDHLPVLALRKLRWECVKLISLVIACRLKAPPGRLYKRLGFWK